MSVTVNHTSVSLSDRGARGRAGRDGRDADPFAVANQAGAARRAEQVAGELDERIATLEDADAPYVLAQSAVQVSHTGTTTETTLATITIPAGALGANGQLELLLLIAAAANNANGKTVRVKLNGVTLATPSLASLLQANFSYRLANRGVVNSQVITINYGGLAIAPITAAADTSQAATITITGQLGNASDTIRIESYQVRMFPKD